MINQEQKIKIGFVGFGRMGITHYSILNTHPKVEIIAISDTLPLVIKLVEKYLKPKAFISYKEMIDKMMPNAIIISTPPNVHYEIIKYASERNIHIFVEKPFTVDINQAKELRDIYEKIGLVNQVGYVYRFNDIFIKLKEFMHSGVIGKLYDFKFEFMSPTIIRKTNKSSWRANKEIGGGVLYEMASHMIDLINYLIGKPDNITGAIKNKINSIDVDDLLACIFLFNSGITGVLRVNWSDKSYRKPAIFIELFGELGKIIADQYTMKIFLDRPFDKYNLKKGWNVIYITDVFEPVPFYVRGYEFTRQLWHFIQCIENREAKSLCSFSDGYNVHEIIYKITNKFTEL